MTPLQIIQKDVKILKQQMCCVFTNCCDGGDSIAWTNEGNDYPAANRIIGINTGGDNSPLTLQNVSGTINVTAGVDGDISLTPGVIGGINIINKGLRIDIPTKANSYVLTSDVDGYATWQAPTGGPDPLAWHNTGDAYDTDRVIGIIGGTGGSELTIQNDDGNIHAIASGAMQLEALDGGMALDSSDNMTLTSAANIFLNANAGGLEAFAEEDVLIYTNSNINLRTNADGDISLTSNQGIYSQAETAMTMTTNTGNIELTSANFSIFTSARNFVFNGDQQLNVNVQTDIILDATVNIGLTAATGTLSIINGPMRMTIQSAAEIYMFAPLYTMVNLPAYADNAAAIIGGLLPGNLYRNSVTNAVTVAIP